MSQAEKWKIGIKRVAAIDSEHIQSKYFTSAPVAACWESHLRAMSMFLSTTESHTVILEDDFKFEDKNLQSLLIRMKNSDLNFLQVGFLATTYRETIYINMENIYDLFVRFYGWLEYKFTSRTTSNKQLVNERNSLPLRYVFSDIRPGAHAYIIDREAARYFVQINQPIFLSTDDCFMAAGPMRSIRMARLRKSAFSQSGSPSSIRV